MNKIKFKTKTIRKLIIGFLLSSMTIGLLSLLHAASSVPQKMSYQARLKVDGKPYNSSVDGTKSITFKIFDTQTVGTGNQLPIGTPWSETISNVVFTNGISSNVVIGSVVSLPETLFDDDSVHYLEVTIDATTLSPREPLYSVPYAFSANKLDGVDTAFVKTGTSIYVSDSSGILPDNVVSTDTIMDHSVTSAKIANGTIVDADVKIGAEISPEKIDAYTATISSTEFSYLDNASSNLQTQISNINTDLGEGAIIKDPLTDQVIQSDNDIIPLTVQAKTTGQTEDLLVVKDGSGNFYVKVSSEGHILMADDKTIDGIDVSSHASSSLGVHGLDTNYSIVGSSGAQTLYNKTLGSGSTWEGVAISSSYIDSSIVRNTELTLHSSTPTWTHGVSNGVIVGTKQDQTLTNKDILDESNNIAAKTIRGNETIEGEACGTIDPSCFPSTVLFEGDEIEGNDIKALSLGDYSIADDTITARVIAHGVIGDYHIAAGTITANEIAYETIVTTNVADDAITAAKIDTDAVTAVKIDSQAVTSEEIKELTIVDGDISETAAIFPTKIYAGDGISISTTEFASLDGFTPAKLNNIVTSSPTVDGLIDTQDANATPLVLRGHASQAVNLFLIEDSGGVDKVWVESDGDVILATDLTVDGVDISTHVLASVGVHGLTGAGNYVVGTSSSQVLTNKTLGSGSTWNGNTIGETYIHTDIARYSELHDHTIATSTHGVTGNIVGTEEYQHIQDKYISVSSITTSTITQTAIDNTNYIDAGALKSGTIDNDRIEDYTIAAVDIASYAVTSIKIASDAVKGWNIDDEAILSSHINDNFLLDGDKLENRSVDGIKISTDTIAEGNLQDNAITSVKIDTEAVNTIDIASEAVTSEKIAESTIVDGDIATDAAISPTKILAAGGVSISSTEFASLDGFTPSALNNIVSSSPTADGLIDTQDANAIPLVLRGHASQAVNLFVIEDSGGSDKVWVESDGDVILATDLTVDGVDISTHVLASVGVHGLTGAGNYVVGTSSTQVLTNKTLGSGSTWEGVAISSSYIDSSIARDSELEAHTIATSTHGVTGNIVGTEAYQHIQDKYISVSSITTSTITQTAINNTNYIEAEALTSGTVPNERLDYSSVTLLGSSIGTDEIEQNAVVSTNIAQGTIIAGDIAQDTIVSTNITQGTVLSEDIGFRTIVSTNIAEQAVSSETIKTDAVRLSHIEKPIISGFIAKHGATEKYSFATDSVDGGTITIKSGTNVEISTSPTGEIIIASIGSVAGVETSSGLYKTESDGVYTFYVGEGPGISVNADSVTVNTSDTFDPTWAGSHTFSDHVAFTTTGEAPFTVADTTLISSLNADQIDGKDVDDGQTASTSYLWTSAKSTGTFVYKTQDDTVSGKITFDRGGGNMPFAVEDSSTVANLSADKVDGKDVDDGQAASTSYLWTSDKSSNTFINASGDTMTGSLIFSEAPSFTKTGATPFTISNTDTGTNLVTNLNADTVDGMDADDASGPSDTVLWSSSKSTQTFIDKTANATVSGALVFTSTPSFAVSSATSPFTVISTTKIDNLNADKIDGKDADDTGGPSDTVLWSSAKSTGTFVYKTQDDTISGKITFDRGGGNMPFEVADSSTVANLSVDKIDGMDADDTAGPLDTVLWSSAKSTQTFVLAGADTMTGDLTMSGANIVLAGNYIQGIGTNYSSFTANGLDMNTGYIENIGNVGTDFTSSGGLVLASSMTISADGALIKRDVDGYLYTTVLKVKADGSNGTILLLEKQTTGANSEAFGVRVSTGYNGESGGESYAFGQVVNGVDTGQYGHAYKILGRRINSSSDEHNVVSLDGVSSFRESSQDIVFDLYEGGSTDRTFTIKNDGGGSGDTNFELTNGGITQSGASTANTFAGASTFSSTPTATSVGGGSIYINPVSAGVTANETLLGIAVEGTQKMRLDAEGDVEFAGGITQSSPTATNVFYGTTTIAGLFISTATPTSTDAANAPFLLNAPGNGGDGNNIILATLVNGTTVMSLKASGEFYVPTLEVDSQSSNYFVTKGTADTDGNRYGYIESHKYPATSGHRLRLVDDTNPTLYLQHYDGAGGDTDDTLNGFPIKLYKYDAGSDGVKDSTDGYYAVYAP